MQFQFVCAASALFATGLVFAQPADRAVDTSILSTLRPEHPRLFVSNSDLERIRGLIETNADARKLCDELRKQAVEILKQPPIEHKLIGPRLLSQSRTCLSRVSTLALMYRLDGDARFAQRAEKEMLTAAGFPDWNPKHFLDTAEMTNALGIGYDWLFDVLSPESKHAIKTAIVEKGLTPGLGVYRSNGWWARSHHNWNQVCNGGLTVGALAIADEEPALAAEIISSARKSIPLAMHTLHPDGGWPEGPGYWCYAMRYTAFYHAALLSALGNDFGLKASSGYEDAGMFRMHCIGPTRHTFNFADGGSGVGTVAQMMFFARLFDKPVYAWHQRNFRGGAEAFELVWFDPRGSEADMKAQPLDVHFKGIDVVFMRSEWNNNDALFVGFKGGDNAANHSNLDLGTFVLDALGQRWAVELGADDYNLPGYWGGKRWTYYRLRTEGQNSLVLNGENQGTKAKAPIVAFESSPQRAFAIAELSEGYAKQAKRVRRGIALLNREHVLVQDEIECTGPTEAVWGMHTPAEVEIEGREAVLSLRGKKLTARLIEPAEAAWSVEPVSVDPPQKPIKGISKLSAGVKWGGEGSRRIRVLISPQAPGRSGQASSVSELMPAELDAWKTGN